MTQGRRFSLFLPVFVSFLMVMGCAPSPEVGGKMPATGDTTTGTGKAIVVQPKLIAPKIVAMDLSDFSDRQTNVSMGINLTTITKLVIGAGMIVEGEAPLTLTCFASGQSIQQERQIVSLNSAGNYGDAVKFFENMNPPMSVAPGFQISLKVSCSLEDKNGQTSPAFESTIQIKAGP